MWHFHITSTLRILVTLTTLTLNAAHGKEDVRIAFLDHDNSSYSLKMYYTGNESEIRLASNLSVGQPKLVLTSHEPSGLFCWVGKLDKGEKGEIHCFHLGNASQSILVLPRIVERSAYETIAGMYIQLDMHGNNIYWTDPNWRNDRDRSRGYIWMTSLRGGSKDSIVLAARSEDTGIYPAFYFSLDSRNGYILTSHSWRYKGVRLLKLWAEAPFGQVAGVGSLYARDDVQGIAVDSIREKFYWIESSSEIQEGFFRDEENAQKHHVIFSHPNYTAAKDFESSFQYLEDTLYWRSSNGSLFSLNLNSNISRVVTDGRIPAFFNVFEDARSGEENPCAKLGCSHICRPTYGYAAGHKCDCPSDMSLINGRDCKPSALLCQTGLGTNKQLHFPDPSHLDADYQVCQISPEPEGARIYPQTYDNVSPCPSLANFSMEHLALKPPFENTPLSRISQVQLDPYGIGYLQHSENKPRCIESFTFQTASSSVSFCVLDVISNFCMDFRNWILFTIESPSTAINLQPFIIGRNFPHLAETYKFPSLDSARYITVDSASRKLFWIGQYSTSLYTSNYDGGLYTILRPSTGIGNFFNFHENRLLYILQRYPGERFADSVNSLNLDTNTTRRLVGSTPLSRLCLLIPAKIGEHPCSASKCSHSCVPHSSTGYTCGCPGYLELVNDTCTTINLLGSVTAAADGSRVGLGFARLNVNETTARITSTKTWLENGTDLQIVLAPRSNLEQLCWAVHGNGTVYCLDSEENVLEQVAEIHPNSSLLAFEPSGNGVFYNDGYPGNLTLKSIITRSVFQFKSFPTTDLLSSALDTQSKILFWSNGRNQILFQALNPNKFDGGGVDISEGSQIKILALTVDTFSSTLYYAQGGALRLISYQAIFSGSSQSLTLLKKENSHFPSLKQLSFTGQLIKNSQNLLYHKKSLYWLRHLGDSCSIIKLDTKTHNVEEVQVDLRLSQIFPANPTDERYEYDPCEKSPCSHFCFPENPLRVFSTSYQCACPQGLSLSNDRACIPPDHSRTILIGVASVIATLLIVSLITALVLKSRRNVQLAEAIYEIRNGNPVALKYAKTEADKAQYLPLTCIIPPSELDVNESKVLGEGAFGLVLQGVYRNTVVALKTLKPSFNLNLLTDFAKEVKIMHYIGYHRNIVRFYGAEISNIKKGYFYAILELSPCGSLIDYLRNIPNSSNFPSPTAATVNYVAPTDDLLIHGYTNTSSHRSPSFPMLFLWAKQIAEGMAYLAGKSVFHGDLAARNILVFDDGKVLKISDFGFSRQLYQDALYTKKNRCRLPWRWSAIESLKFFTFSTKSDVWSYGVTLWEIFTCGQVPYPEYEWNDEFTQLLESGLTLSKPENVPEAFYEKVMKPCWTLESEQRPDFEDILIKLQNQKSTLTFPSSVIYEAIQG